MKKPKYKIGDIVVYKYQEPLIDSKEAPFLYQGEIIGSAFDIEDESITEWLYVLLRNRTEREGVSEKDILYIIN